MGKAKKPAAKTRTVRVHQDTVQDVADISYYIGVTQQQPLNAIKVSEAIEKAIDKIALNPFAYKECEHLPTKTKIYRQAVCLSWLIIYKLTVNEIVVLGVIHTSRRPARIKKLRGKN
ncbi:MAG: type II toxin-antitoxin system RelE/ParE family toxin [Acinetobacter sp.]|nr:MAG: type II toxin-antitoxin system RelE/ParE family toxin [Acinetobacter sp.]